LFLQNTRKGKSVPIALAERAFTLPDSLPNGQFETTLTVQHSELEATIQQDPFGRRFVQFCAHLPEDDQRLFAGEIELISPEGTSVISDVDDTIKITNVGDRKELLANTFTREFRSVEGMKSLYQSWAKSGVSFHYVSASPWPLYRPLVDWLDADGFPAGTMHLRHIRLRDLRADRKKETAYHTKKSAIEDLLRLFPQRRFILCGDSGERDAELYAGIARDFGPQILHVAIRHDPLAKNGESHAKLAARFSQLDRSRWTVFQRPEDLHGLLDA
jgi:phosphatidate phosphatase APP1